MKIAFIGLGAMGYPMARNLARQHEVIVWNRTIAVAEKHVSEHGTKLARSLEELADADVVLTMLPTSREVDQIVDLLAGKLKARTLWFDATSGDPGSSRATTARLSELGIDFVDAPVTGGIVGAEAGTLTFMIGGSKDGFRRAEEIAREMGKVIVHVGEAGSGHAIKAIANTIMGANLWIAAEGLMSLKKLGFDMKVALEVLNASSARSNVTENLLPKRLVDGEWPLAFKLALHDKDIRIASSLVHEQHLSTPMLTLTSSLFTAARRSLGEEADYIEVAKFIAGELNNESW